MTELTNDQCDEFRRYPGSFNDMVRHIFKAGRESMREEAMDACLRIYRDEYPDAEDFETGYEYLAIKELP